MQLALILVQFHDFATVPAYLETKALAAWSNRGQALDLPGRIRCIAHRIFKRRSFLPFVVLSLVGTQAGEFAIDFAGRGVPVHRRTSPVRAHFRSCMEAT
jgi:hypothetical protein